MVPSGRHPVLSIRSDHGQSRRPLSATTLNHTVSPRRRACGRVSVISRLDSPAGPGCAANGAACDTIAATDTRTRLEAEKAMARVYSARTVAALSTDAPPQPEGATRMFTATGAAPSAFALKKASCRFRRGTRSPHRQTYRACASFRRRRRWCPHSMGCRGRPG
jgi:hypothetical protein